MIRNLSSQPAGRAPVRMLLGAGVLAGTLAFVPLVLALWLIRGESEASSAALGALGVLGALTLATLGFTALLRAGRRASVVSALLAFALPLLLLGVLFVRLREQGWFDPVACTLGMLGVALAFQIGALLGFRHSRILVFDAPADSTAPGLGSTSTEALR